MKGTLQEVKGMKVIMKKRIACLMTAVMVFASSLAVSADAVSEKPYLSLGADLKVSEKEIVLDLLGVDSNDLDSYNLGEVTNDEEHEYLSEYVSASVIGSRALSSVLVVLESNGKGINVETSNITYCTSGMYRNALATAGVEDATIKVAGPFNITGTAALVGVMKAYEDMTGEEISEESKDAATNELVATGEVAESLGDKETAEELIALIKDKVVSDGLQSEDAIMGAIEDACDQLEVTLTDEDRQMILDLMEKISELDIDIDQLKDQAKAVYDKLVDMGIDVKSESFWQSVKDALNSLIDKIMGFLG